MGMNRLQDRFKGLLRDTDTRFHRYMYHAIDWNSRMIGLTGPRGVGKTTLVLQYIKENLPVDTSLYVTAEDFYFADHRLLDLADEFVKQGGKRLFIDEIHRYKDWARELKLMYDYHPGLQIVFTGSSVLDINKGAADLSRRALMYHMQGLSFREYLNLFHGFDFPAYSLEEILALRVDAPSDFRPFRYFPDYLARGYYPFGQDAGEERLAQIVNLALETDIPQYAGMNVSTGRKLKQLLAVVAKSVPFKPNVSSLATALGVSRNSVADYCLYVEEAGLIMQLRDDTGGIRGLGKVEKIYLDNPNLIHVLRQEQADTGNVRETFFLNQTRVRQEVVASSVADFSIGPWTFEVGGRRKGRKQVEGVDHAFIVKDGIEFGQGNIIPLWHFGFNY